MHNESVVNAELKVELYEYDPSVSVQTSAPILLEESDYYNLTASDINAAPEIANDSAVPPSGIDEPADEEGAVGVLPPPQDATSPTRTATM